MAYSHNNYTAKGLEGRRSGNVADFRNSWSKMIQVNDGKRNFSLKIREYHDQQAPFYENQETIIELTHEDYDISQIHEN